MAVEPLRQIIDAQDYLAGESLADTRHEYIAGEVYAMAGATPNHNRIATNLARWFGNHLDGTSCETFVSDLKVKAGPHFFYPDLMVVCDRRLIDDCYTDAPILTVEILSKTTRRIDKTLKRQAYQALPSLLEYVLIEQDIVEVEVCRRHLNWQSEYAFLGDRVWFESIELSLPVADIYARVDNDDLRTANAGSATGEPTPT